MKTRRSTNTGSKSIVIAAILLAVGVSSHAQFTNADWPSTINSNAPVDYAIFDVSATFASTPPGWNQTVSMAGGGDQMFITSTLDGLAGDQATSSFLNPADANYAQFATVPNVDILLQVFGDDSLYNANGTGKTITFREGILGTELPVSAGTVPAGGNNGHWNWMLFSVTNPVSPHVENTTGLRYIGFQSSTVGPGAQNGGVNGGTLRIEGVAGISIRAAAIGPAGAFGASNVINAVFQAPAPCNPEPPINLAFVDINASVTNHLVVLNNLDQTVTYTNSVGPVGDLRKAVQAAGIYMNFGITSNYLGYPCNTPRPMKVCVEFYDDPALAGGNFGPEMYAVDNLGHTATFGGPLYTFTGSGQWLRLAFWIPAVNLAGVNTSPLTGGPRLIFNGAAPFIDRIELGVVRSRTNALAGLDPDPSFFMNPFICTTNYAYYAELDLKQGITNGLDVGSSGGDQQMVLELAGPADDMRLSLSPANGNNNLQFQILNQVFGPTYQDNEHVAIALTYYDDPTKVGATLKPQVYRSFVNGLSTISFPAAPYNTSVTLQGTGRWRDAFFELANANFEGVNQGPQSLVRYQTGRAVPADPTSGNVHVSRVRYNVIRPCGPNQGINMFQFMRIRSAAPSVSVSWFGQATLQSSLSVTGSWSDLLSLTNYQTNSYVPPTPASSQYFRLKFRPLP